MNIQTVHSSMIKRAGAKGELASNLAQAGLAQIPTVVTQIPGVINGAGSIVGAFSSPATEAEESKWDAGDSEVAGLLPGVAGYRMARRRKRQLKADEGGTPHYWSQAFGPLSALLIASGLGALGGGVVGGATNGFKNDTNALIGAGIGAGVGAGGAALSELGALIAAAIKRRRSKEEQKAYANSSTASEWLVPGVATYNAWKTMGRVIGDSEEREAAKAKEQAPAGALATA